MKAYFKEDDIGLLTNRKDLKLLTVNSPTNLNQTDKKKLEAFVNLVNTFSSTVRTFGTVLSGDLNRHYCKLLYKDEAEIKKATLTIDIDFLKNFFTAMKFNQPSRGIALLLQQLAVDLGIDFSNLGHSLGFDPNELITYTLQGQVNSLNEFCKSPRGIKQELMTWSKLRQHPVFEPFKQQLENYYNNDDRYKAAADPIIGGYAKKYFEKANKEIKEKSINQQITFAECKEAAKNYLLEECSMIFVLETLGYHVATYPGTLNDAIQYVYTNYMQSCMPWIEYKFNKWKINSPDTLFYSPGQEVSTNAKSTSDDQLFQAIILHISMYGLTKHSIRAKFLSEFILFLCRYANIPTPRDGQVMSHTINPNISEEDALSSIRLNIVLLGLNHASIRSSFYQSFMSFLFEFQQSAAPQAETANSTNMSIAGPVQ